jgi:hypothetical protein
VTLIGRRLIRNHSFLYHARSLSILAHSLVDNWTPALPFLGSDLDCNVWDGCCWDLRAGSKPEAVGGELERVGILYLVDHWDRGSEDMSWVEGTSGGWE